MEGRKKDENYGLKETYEVVDHDSRASTSSPTNRVTVRILMGLTILRIIFVVSVLSYRLLPYLSIGHTFVGRRFIYLNDARYSCIP